MVFCGNVIFTSPERWKESQEVLKAVHNELQSTLTRLWMIWHSDVSSLLSKTSRYTYESVEETSNLDAAWQAMVQRSARVWEKIVNVHSVFSTNLDEWEKIKLHFARGDHDVPVDLATDIVLEVEDNLNSEWVHL